MSKDKGALAVEEQGIDTISEDERKGTPASMFWPWFAANISMFAMSYGAWALGFGISFWQATIMTIIGVVVSFLLVGIISIAGKRGNAPTMVITRATFGVEGAKVPAALSWIATLGWEISLTTTAVLALSSTITKLGWGSGAAPKLITAIVVVGLVVVAGIFGYDLIMRCQQVITIVTGAITVGFFILGWGRIDFAAIGRIPSGSLPAMLGCCFFVMTGFGLGWVNIAADYSRYLPRKASMAASSSGLRSARPSPMCSSSSTACCWLVRMPNSLTTSATTRLVPWRPSCPLGTSSHTPSWLCWASCPDPSWTTTPMDWRS